MAKSHGPKDPQPTPPATPEFDPLPPLPVASPELVPEIIATAVREPFETIAARLGTRARVVAAVKASNRWGQGREVTEQEFKDAIARALGATMLSK